MKKLLPLFLLSISLTSYGQYVLRKDQLNAINARDIKAGGAYSSFKLGKLIDSLILSLNSQKRAAGYIPVGNSSGTSVDVALSGDGTLSSSGALSVTKLLGNTIPSNASGALINNGSGVLSWTTVSSSFQSLTDGPGSFSGKTLNHIRVNAGETALEYRTPSQTLSDIGAQGTISLTTTGSSGAATFIANTLNIPQYAGTTTLAGLTDANISSPSNSQFLQYQTSDSKWHNHTLVSGDIPTLNQNTTGSAATLTTPRTIGTITGDATSAGSSFDGSTNNTNALTLATVNSNVGTFGSATQSLTATVNGKGLITAMSAQTVTPAVGSITGLGIGVATALGINVGSAGAFTTFNGAGGTPSSITLTNATGLPLTTGVTGTLPVANGGTGLATTTAYGLIVAGTTSTGNFQQVSGAGTSGQVLKSNGASALPTWSSNNTGDITVQTLTDASTISWDVSLGINGSVTIAATGRTLSISNAIAGQVYILKVIQDGTGSRTITTWPSGTKWVGGSAPTLTTTASAIDMIVFFYDGTNYFATYTYNYQ